jgi:hypothetical protein
MTFMESDPVSPQRVNPNLRFPLERAWDLEFIYLRFSSESQNIPGLRIAIGNPGWIPWESDLVGDCRD